MRVLFLMFAFPDMNVSFNMYTALVDQFVNNRHEVFVVAPGNQQRKTEISIEKGISILRVRTLPIKNVGNIRKGIANLLLPYQYDRAINKHFRNKKFDLVVMPTPPLTLVDIATKIKKRDNAFFYCILRDIFPQNAVDLGFIRKGGLIHRYFRQKEHKLYTEADAIGCMSDGNIRYVLDHNKSIPESKPEILHNFQIKYENIQNRKPIDKDSYGLKGKFVVVFGGNMGKPQQLENVIELAKRCLIYPDVLFLLLGEGLVMQRLEKTISERKISNIRILGTIPKHEYQDLVHVCDIGLISLHQNFTIPNIPSKTLDYFNVGLPVLASIDKATDYRNVLDNAKAGLWSYSGDIEAFKNNFDTLYLNPEIRKEMGKAGHKYFEQYLTPDIAYQKIVKHLI
jgi:glycosyltransferase involved in cell wall biosynthesis